MPNEENKDVLRNYKFIKTIGEGTFGKVKLSIHLLTNEYVAIKILEKSKITDKDDLERIEKEIKYLKLFDHPNIIQIYEVIENSQNYYIVMEYVPYGELFNYIVENERINEKEASFFYSQIIHGLNEIYKKGICHRDIKPENLLLTHQKIIKIIDFGLSNEYIDTLDTQCGSPCYAAPEIIRGMKYNGLMVDLWASGIILFAMLFGYLPFDDKDNNILFRKILECNLTFPKDINVSSEAKDLISKILIPNPHNRIQLEEILKHPFLVSGNIQYHNMMKPKKFNQDDIIINYMVNILKYSNIDNSILKLVKANKHNGCTTTYKLLKKQLIENRFNYDLYLEKMAHILPYTSPIRNIKIKKNYLVDKKSNINNIKSEKKTNNNEANINNINVIYKKKDSVNKDILIKENFLLIQNKEKGSRNHNLKENNNKIYKAHSTDNTKISKKINNFSIRKKIKLNINKRDISNFDKIKNNNLIVKNLRTKLLYNKILFGKNTNNFKKNIDTSISVDRKKIVKYNKKRESITPSKKKKNPFVYENESYQYNNSKRKKILYFPNHLLQKSRGKSEDKINKNIKYKYIKTLLLNTFLEKNKNRYSLTPINLKIYNKYNALSMDKPNKMKNKFKKNDMRINNYLLTIENKNKNSKHLILNHNINIHNNTNNNINNTNRQKSPCFRNIKVLNDNIYKNNLTKKNTNDNKKTRIINSHNINNINNNINYKYNNFKTIQLNPSNNSKSNNSININTNIIYNCQINNEYNRDVINKKEINKNTNKIKHINKNLLNEAYLPLNKRNKNQIRESIYSERFKTLSTIDESSLNYQNVNLQRKQLKKLFIGDKNIKSGNKEYK